MIDVSVHQGAKVIAGTFTDAFGRFTVQNLAPGEYTVVARLIGYRAGAQTLVLAADRSEVDANFRLSAAPVEVAKVEVFGQAPLTVNTRTGDQAFQQSQYHGAPSTTTSQILQQSIAGAVRAPTGEVHIRGQHAEYTYFIDGLPVPAGISGSLNELFDPEIINHVDFKTGGWDAEYGNKNAAIVDIGTRVPSGAFHVDASGYGGSFNANGQSLSASTSRGKLGVFASGTRQVTDMRQEPVMFDPANNAAINFHNHGEDLFAFGKLQYLLRSSDALNLDLNWSRTKFAAPFDSTGGAVLDDHQEDQNSFANFGWRHQFNATSTAPGARGGELFAGVFARQGSLTYTPGSSDQAQFVFFPDTTTAYNLRENRKFTSTGLKADYSQRMRRGLELKTGVLASITSGQEDFVTTSDTGTSGPASNSNLNGSDAAVYVQASISPANWWELRPGVRYDAHHAPFAGTQSQVSPRIRLNLFPSAASTVWLYYGRLFLPTNVEDLRAITSVAQAGVSTSPTLPERDHFYEVGYVHRFPQGFVAKLSGYRKDSSPGIDDNTVPGSNIVTSVNIDRVHVTGIEAVIEAKPAGSVSGYVNAALNHAYGRGPITGGFFPEDTPAGDFDLDHDQRLSIVASVTYAAHQLFASVTDIYGSGLTNGNAPDASYGTGLLDFDKSIHVPASSILNASVGYALTVGHLLVRPELYVDNALDRKYLLKGAFFSGASVGRRRSVQFKLNVGI